MPRLISLDRINFRFDQRKQIRTEDLIAMIRSYIKDRYRPHKKEMQKKDPKYDDAKACWFDTRVFLELLGFDEQTVQTLQQQVENKGISGIRIYYGTKEVEVEDEATTTDETPTDEADAAKVKRKDVRHNLVLVSTSAMRTKGIVDLFTLEDRIGDANLVAVADHQDLEQSAQNGGNLCPPTCRGTTLLTLAEEGLPPEDAPEASTTDTAKS